MREEPDRDRLRELDARLSRFRAQERGPAESEGAVPTSGMSGFGMAMRIGTELVAGLAVGVGIGYLLDRWLGTAPWLMVVFFFIGAAAGILNVYRSASGLGDDAGTGARKDLPGTDGTAGGPDEGNSAGGDAGTM